MTEPIFETIKVCDRAGEFTQQVKVECKTDLLTSDVAKILNVCAVPNTCNGEINASQIKYSGRVVFYVIYLDNNGVVNNCECSSEYSGAISATLPDGAYVKTDVWSQKVEYDISGNKLIVASYLLLTFNAYANDSIKLLCASDDFICDKKELSYVKGYGLKKGVYPMEEEYELNYALSKILSQKAKAHVTAVQCGVGCIIVDGQLYTSVLLLQNIEKSDIIREEKIFPFRMEIEYDEAMPAMNALARVSEKSFKLDATIDGDNNKSKLSFSVTLCFEGEAFSTENITAPIDLFSLTKVVETEKDCKSYLVPIGVKTITSKVKGRCASDTLPAGARLMSVNNESVEILSSERKGENLVVSGVASMTGLLRDSEGVEFSVDWQTPFETQVDLQLKDCYQVEVSVFTFKPSARIISINEAEIEIDISLCLSVYEKGCINYLKSAKCGENKKVNTSPISVYIARSGEDLWSLSKRLNVCPDQLIENNTELQFPLTGEERIVVYRQK